MYHIKFNKAIIESDSINSIVLNCLFYFYFSNSSWNQILNDRIQSYIQHFLIRSSNRLQYSQDIESRKSKIRFRRYFRILYRTLVTVQKQCERNNSLVEILALKYRQSNKYGIGFTLSHTEVNASFTHFKSVELPQPH